MQKYDKGLVSLILPIYNVEKYLSACIEACICQVYSNIEIILVDDGSKDDCPRICDEYAAKDTRIKVIHKANGGLSDARNEGIKHSKGQWIAFIDSDDLVSKYYVEAMLNQAVLSQAPMVWCAIQDIEESTGLNNIDDTMSLSDSFEVKTFTKQEAEMQFYNMWGMQKALVAWNKLYHRSLFTDEAGNQILYAMGKIFEDGFTTYKYIYQASKVVYVDLPLYFYRQRQGSIMKENRIINFDPALEAGVERLDFYKAKNEHEIYMLELNYTIYSPIRFYEKIKDASKRKELKIWFKKIYYDYFIKESWPKGKRIRMWAFLNCYPLYCIISAFEGVYNRICKK